MNAFEDEKTSNRNFVIAEIMATEKVYFDKLNALMDVFIGPLEQLKLISDEEMALQFGPLKKIYDVHKKMYEDMFYFSETKEFNIPNLFSDFVSNLSEYKVRLLPVFI
jgi:hypothetical protein